MRLTRRTHFTFWHYLRAQTYTAGSRKRMADAKLTYLEHLARWLDYEDELSSPRYADGVNAGTDSAGPVPRIRVDSFVETERSNVALRVAQKHALGHAATSKRGAGQGEAARMQVLFPLPSCAGEEEGWADGREAREEMVAQASTVAQKIKNLLVWKVT